MLGSGTLIGFIIFPIIHLVAIERKNISPFFPPQHKTFFALFLVMALGLTFIITISPLVEWNMNMEFPDFLKGVESWARDAEDKAAELTKAMTSFESVGDLVLGLIVIALLPAIGEELVFRGLFQNEFFRGSGNIHLSIWLAAIIFSAIHLQFYGFVPRLLLGALFGYLYYWSGSLLIPMFAHFVNNAIWRYYGLSSPPRDHGPQCGRQCRCTASIRNFECCANSRATVLYLETLSTTSEANF